jgi:hypothetical protein
MLPVATGVILPDNLLFEAGRAGEGIRKQMLDGFSLTPQRLIYSMRSAPRLAGLKEFLLVLGRAGESIFIAGRIQATIAER